MKIIHLCDSLNPAGLGGYESYLHYLSEELSVRGNKSVIITQSPRRDSPNSIELEHYTIHHLPGNYLEARKWEFYSLPEESREKEVERLFARDDLERNIDSLAEQLVEILEEIRPDLIHAHSTYVVFNRVLQKLREEGVVDSFPVIVTIHGRPKSLILPNGKQTTDYESFSEVCPFDHILAVSKNVAEELRRVLSIRKHNIHVSTLYLGVNLSVFSPERSITKEWDIAFMGRFEPMKAVDLFPEMLVKLKKRCPNLKFLMTGEGSLKNDLIGKFESRDVADLVEYLGVVKTERVPELINKSLIFIYPSREEHFGLSILEAMACGVPVVTTNVFGPSEILTQNIDGLMVPPDNVEALVESIQLLLQNENFRTVLGNNARKTVESRFDIKRHCDELMDFYENMIESKKNRHVEI